jgi:hypothetical protein
MCVGSISSTIIAECRAETLQHDSNAQIVPGALGSDQSRSIKSLRRASLAALQEHFGGLNFGAIIETPLSAIE